MAPVTSSLAMSDFGLRPDDVKYFHCESRIQGKGPDRLKYLDIEGRWILSGKSIPYISAAFNHLQTLNDARVPFREIIDQPLNAIGMVGWTPSSQPVEVPKPKAPPRFIRPPVFVEDEEVPPSPREVVPHRSAGYGPAHQKRKLSIPDRSRSASPQKQPTAVVTDFDKYAKYERHRKDSVTRYGTRWGDAGYGSASPSPTPGDYYNDQQPLPHRTPSLSPRSRDRSLSKTELLVRTKPTEKIENLPYRTGGYGSYHDKRQYDLSPRSIGSYSSDSEQGSPIPSYERNADEILLMAYHSRGRLPRVQRPL